MKKSFFTLALIFICLKASTQGDRIALVIGNANYPANTLANPVNDAMDIEKALSASGFEVKVYTDLSQTEMRRAIDKFGIRLSNAEVGLFFYAGHGIQAKGHNYLIPVDASIKTENDVEYNCVDAGRILAKMEDAGTKTNIVILDACRDNPFERSWSRTATGTGLAFMNAPYGSIIAYSTAPGKTASDGYDRNSPYTSALIHYMKIPNLKIEDCFKLVRVKVRENTNNQQVPWESTSLEGDFYFKPDPGYVTTDIPASDIAPETNVKPIYPDKVGDKRKIIHSLAILPFENYTGDENLNYVAAGMHFLLISDIQKIGALRVIGKTSSNAYKNTDKSAPEIADELNVDLLIEPALISYGDSVCVLIRAVTTSPVEEQIMEKEFRVEKREILGFYGLVTKEIAREVNIELSPEEVRLLSKSTQVNIEAYDQYLKARSYFSDPGKEGLNKALEYLNSAVEKAPDWAPLYAGLAELWMWIQQAGFEAPSVAAPKIFENLNKAMELDPDIAEVHYLSAMIAHLVDWDWKKSEKEFLKTLAINPNDSWSRLLYSQLLLILQRNDEALAQRELAADLDPLNPAERMLYAGTLIQAGDFESGMKVAEELLTINPMDLNVNFLLELAAYKVGEYDKVIRVVKYSLPFTIEDDAYRKIERIYHESGIVAAYDELLMLMEKYAENGPISPIDIAIRCMMANKPEKALDWIEKGYELHDPQVTYITATGRFFEQLYGNPRFIDIVNKMKLPFPKPH